MLRIVGASEEQEDKSPERNIERSCKCRDHPKDRNDLPFLLTDIQIRTEQILTEIMLLLPGRKQQTLLIGS